MENNRNISAESVLSDIMLTMRLYEEHHPAKYYRIELINATSFKIVEMVSGKEFVISAHSIEKSDSPGLPYSTFTF